jgi:hypothetical protein
VGTKQCNLAAEILRYAGPLSVPRESETGWLLTLEDVIKLADWLGYESLLEGWHRAPDLSVTHVWPLRYIATE